MARPRSPAFNDQRDLIVSRAAEFFATRGYLGASVGDVAEACGLSKPSFYHYFEDKEDLLMSIADRHVSTLLALVEDVETTTSPGQSRLELLIHRFLAEYAGAQNAHRVLTEDVKYLREEKRETVLTKQRRVVKAFSNAIVATRPGLCETGLDKPLAMLLFGMLNWMFTWHRHDGPLTHEAMGSVVVDLFLGGLHQVRVPNPARPTL